MSRRNEMQHKNSSGGGSNNNDDRRRQQQQCRRRWKFLHEQVNEILLRIWRLKISKRTQESTRVFYSTLVNQKFRLCCKRKRRWTIDDATAILFAINNEVKRGHAARMREYPHSQLWSVAMSCTKCVRDHLEKYTAMSLHNPDEAPKSDSCYECIRLREAVVTNYQRYCNKSRNRIIINFRMRFT